MKKYNLGCGRDYIPGYINVDSNPRLTVDIRADLLDTAIVTGDADYVLLKGVLEHIPAIKVFRFLDELYRISHHGTIIDITVPHYSAVAAHYPQHYTYWGVGAFFTMAENLGRNECGEWYTDFKCEVEKIELRFWSKDAGGSAKRLGLSRFGGDWFWNLGGLVWQQFWERFNVFGFDEINYRLKVVKGGTL